MYTNNPEKELDVCILGLNLECMCQVTCCAFIVAFLVGNMRGIRKRPHIFRFLASNRFKKSAGPCGISALGVSCCKQSSQLFGRILNINPGK